MKMYCPQCGQRITAEQISLASSTAVCPSCDNVFGFAPVLQEDRLRQSSSPTLAQSQIVPRPARMHVEDWAGFLTIRWRWFRSSIVFLTLFCIGWDSFLVFWYKAAFAGGQLL